MKKESVIQQKIDEYLSDMNMDVENLKLGSDSLKLEWDMIMKLKMKKESVIQQEIVEYLSGIAEKYNFFFFSIPNEGFMKGIKMIMRTLSNNKNSLQQMLFKTNVLMKKMGMVPGMPDLCLLHDGRAYMFEIKRPDGKLTEKQAFIIGLLNYKIGIKAYIIYSVDEMKDKLLQLEIIK